MFILCVFFLNYKIEEGTSCFFVDRKKEIKSWWSVVFLFIHGAITTHPDLQRLEWALSALLHHLPAYLMSKESNYLLIIAL